MYFTMVHSRYLRSGLEAFASRLDVLFPKTVRFSTIGLSLLLTLLISGCINLGPDYKQPEVAVEPNWLDIEDPLITSEAPADPNWWESAFQDPNLNHLVETALQQNLTLRSAGLRVLQSQQQLAIAIGNQFPQQQQVSGLASREKSSGDTFENYNIGFNVGWEVDFWGRFRRHESKWQITT
jgi:outer membrane protein TolC